MAARGLHRHFGGVLAVDGATFEVRRGTITGMIGPNGAGKSTVLALLAGALMCASGSIVFDGVDVTSRSAYARARLGLIRTFQASSEFPRLTVLENLLVASRSRRGDSVLRVLAGPRTWRRDEEADLDRARALLGRFELSGQEQEYAGNLSGGQKRLLEIARGLMAEPKLLLLDEPMAGVNPALIQRIEEHLAVLRDEGLTMLMVEHELGVVERLCEPTIVMAQGRVLSEGTMAELRANEAVLDAYLS